ncbi:MAG: porin [Verrucomicrobia bacterium]|nr:porin [Verrucomicrobiota bacterium]
MKFNKWTLALAAGGVVSLGVAAQAEEAQNQVMTSLSSTTLSGYVDTSAIWQMDDGVVNAGRSFDRGDKQDGFNLNVVKLSLEKPLDEANWAAGYKVDLLFGPDANLYGTTSPLAIDASDFAVKQAYVNMRAPVGNGIDLKMGVFDTIIGYEVFESGSNPNYSRSYGYGLEPFSHTGLLASYRVSEWLGLSAGVANTYGNSINARPFRSKGAFANVADESEKTYMGSVALTAPERFGFLAGATLYGGVIDGLGSGFNNNARKDTTWYYAGVTMPTPVQGLAVGVSYDYRSDFGYNIVGDDGENHAYALAGYVSYQASEKIRVNNRLEYASGSDGTFYDSRADGAVGEKNELLANTFTVDYALWKNVITRGEFRWDHELANEANIIDNERNAYSLALNVIYKF